MDKLKNGRWSHQRATSEDVYKTLDEMKAAVNTYGWENETLSPYGYGIKISELIKSWEGFKQCTPSSKSIIIAEMNGAIDILNHWLALKAEPQVTVILLGGNQVTVAESTARELEAIGAIKQRGHEE